MVVVQRKLHAPHAVYRQVVDSLHACVCNMYHQILRFISDVNIIEDVQLISQSVKGRGSLCIVLCPDHPNSMHLLNSEPDSKLLRTQPDLRRVTMGQEQEGTWCGWAAWPASRGGLGGCAAEAGGCTSAHSNSWTVSLDSCHSPAAALPTA